MPTNVRLCEHCGTSFAPSNPSKGRFCSRRCNGLATGRLAAARPGPRPDWSGAGHPNWQGGEYRDARDGYVWCYAPNHPRVSHRKRHRYVKRAVLIAEQTLGRFLVPGEHVHHRNGVKDDDRPENLEVVSPQAHRERHPSTPPVLRGRLAKANKLTEEDVRAIRAAAASGEKQIPLAKRFGISQATAWAIIHRKSWAWLE